MADQLDTQHLSGWIPVPSSEWLGWGCWNRVERSSMWPLFWVKSREPGNTGLQPLSYPTGQGVPETPWLGRSYLVSLSKCLPWCGDCPFSPPALSSSPHPLRQVSGISLTTSTIVVHSSKVSITTTWSPPRYKQICSKIINQQSFNWTWAQIIQKVHKAGLNSIF